MRREMKLASFPGGYPETKNELGSPFLFEFSRRKVATLTALLAFALAIPLSSPAVAQEAPAVESVTASDSSDPESKADAKTDTEDQQLDKDGKFAKYMTGASLKGRFTVTGRGEMPEEIYTISKCEKLPEENLYRFTARIQYGDTDTELPLDIPVEWAGDTPVISLTKMWIPGMGTFSARVLIYQDTYAGTWTHDDVGGQMFGVIVKGDPGVINDVAPPSDSSEANTPKSTKAAPDRID